METLTKILCFLSFILAIIDTSIYWWIWLIASLIFLIIGIVIDR